MPQPRIWVLFAGALAAAFSAGFVLVPVLDAAHAPGTAALAALYHPLCHQLPSRSLAIDGRPLAVCARCAGLYVGGTLALLASGLSWSLLRFARPRWVVAAAVPTVFDVLARFGGWQGLENTPRLLLAVPAGFFAGILLAVGIADLALIASASRADRLGSA